MGTEGTASNSVIDMCEHYGYDLHRHKSACEKGHVASLKCHSARKDCPDYHPSTHRRKG